MQVVTAGRPVRTFPIGRDAGRKQNLAVNRTAHRPQHLGAPVQPHQPLLDARERRRIDQVELVHDQEVRRRDLLRGDLRFAQMALDVLGVDHRDHGIERQPRVLDAVDQRFGIGQTGRLDDDQVRTRGIDQLLDREVEAVVVDRAADAAA